MFFKRLILAIVITLAITKMGNCQCLTINLIKNPSLEDYYFCPTEFSLIHFAKYWTQPRDTSTGPGSSDYYNTCALDLIPSYNTFLISYYKYSFFGNGYAGIFLLSPNPTTQKYREYIQGELSVPLISGKCYYGEFWVLPYVLGLNTLNFSAIDAIGIYFSDTLPKTILMDELLLNSQINNPTEDIIADTLNWTKISGVFYANGGEKFLTVGAFKNKDEINSIYYSQPNVPVRWAYYFFDNFSLCPCEDTIAPKEPEPVVYIANIFSPNNDGQNDVLYVRGENIKELDFSVYNRWGEKVFECHDKTTGWDGTYKGKPCADGVYYYMAEIGFEGGKQEMRKGSVTLVR